MIFHGNELSVGIILGAWMVWVGVGSLIAGRHATHHSNVQLTGGKSSTSSSSTSSSSTSSSSTGIAGLTAIGLAVPLVLPATIVVVRMLRAFFPVPPGAYLSVADMAISVFIVTAPVGMLLGALFVLLARTWRQWDRAEDTGGAGKTYVTEALGNAVGGILFTFILVGRIGSFHSVVLVGIGMAVATVISLPTGYRGRVPLVFLVVAMSVSLVFLGYLDRWAYERQWETFSPEHELVDVQESRYGMISVAWRDGQYSFYQSGNLVFSAASSSLEEQEAVTAAHVAMTQHPDPGRVLLLGGGLRGTLREALRHPIRDLDYVELDPVLTETALHYLPQDTVAALSREEVRLIHGDGRRFLKAGLHDAEPGMYDLILLDIPDPATAVLNRYYTEEFFREAARRLSPGGIITVSVGSTPDLRGRAIANRNSTLFHTLRRVFPEVLPVGDRTLTFFATREPGILTTDPWTLQARYVEREIRDSSFSPHEFTLLFEPEPMRRRGWILRHHGRDARSHLEGPEAAPLLPPSMPEQEELERELPPVVERYFINSDIRPIGYVHTLAYWNTLTRGTGDRLFRWSLRVQPWWILPPVVIVVLVTAGLRLFRSEGRAASLRFAVLFAVFTTGLSTMALQVALLMVFQSVFGYVYEMIGLIVAGFMTGLALGALAARRFVRKPDDIRVLRAVQLVIALCAVLIGLALPGLTAVTSRVLLPVLFLALTVFAGVLNGFDFPLTSACRHRTGGDPDSAAGLVYGIELLGACVGAVLASVAVAPVLGIVACCYLAAIGNATAHGILWIPGRR